ncbi:MAG: hypothetical protein IPM48_06815 [Saprospiraceae bacterium]|nr:hypothetical protein [Saprospiraceae bacterium]
MSKILVNLFSYRFIITIILTSFFLNSSNELQAQGSSLIESFSYDSDDFDSTTTNFINYKINDSSTVDYCFSILNPLPDFLDDSAHFVLNIQGSISNQLVEPTDYQYENDSNYTYSGRFVGSEGWITLVSNNHSRSATVYYPGYFIEYIPLRGDSCICIKLSDSPENRPACDIEQEVYNEDVETIYGCSSTSCATIVRVLLLITPQAESKLPNRDEIKTLSKKWAENINLAFRNSYIPHRIEIELDYYNFTNYAVQKILIMM